MTNMETLFIGYPPCSTCKKAYKVLQDLGIEATYRNIKEDNPTKEEIQSWIDRGVELKKLFNTSGMLYRELNVKEKRETYTEEQLIELLASNGMLVKRPIVIQGDNIIIGNKVSEYENAGVPKTLNGKAMKVSEIITELNRLGGENGIGIIDIVENRVVGTGF